MVRKVDGETVGEVPNRTLIRKSGREEGRRDKTSNSGVSENREFETVLLVRERISVSNRNY